VTLNHNAQALCDRLAADAERFRAVVHRVQGGGTVIDLGIQALGGLEAGRMLAEICMAGLARVALVPGTSHIWPGPAVAVATDEPVTACLASQYAGWKIRVGEFFAMGSGPMRAAAAQEELFEKIGRKERPDLAVGVLETRQLPTSQVTEHVAQQCGVDPQQLTLLVAPTASQAGTVQVVARCVETALHKLFHLGFDLERVESGWGTAPLPPVAADDLAGIGRTNDAVLYGAEVTLWVRGDDQSLEHIGPQLPSSASPEHGEPFASIFQRYEGDFYQIDPLLFSPAVVNLANLDTGRWHRFGKTLPEVIHRSFTS
jgi:methenyltetrahydromethanopterin cyclohydrolase